MTNGFVTVISKARISKERHSYSAWALNEPWNQLQWVTNASYGLGFELWWQNPDGSTDTRNFNPVHGLIEFVKEDKGYLYYKLNQEQRLSVVTQTHQFLRRIQGYRTWEFHEQVLDPESLSWKIEVNVNEHHEETWRAGVTVQKNETTLPVWVR